MKVPRSLSKLLENKYVLYIVFFLAVTNVFGYLITQNIKAVGLFILIGYLVYIFNKNMIIVLGVPLIFTALYVSTGAYKEGLENVSDTAYVNPDDKGLKSQGSIQGQLPMDRVNTDAAESESEAGGKTLGRKLTEGTVEAERERAVSGAGAGAETDGMSNYRKKSSRLDYAATVEDAYGDLNQILGGDGIKRLTEDTQKLMNQQLQLADAMQSLTPLLTQAKSLVGSFDLKNLGGLADLAKQFGAKS